jgi:hypothetical protein
MVNLGPKKWNFRVPNVMNVGPGIFFHSMVKLFSTIVNSHKMEIVFESYGPDKLIVQIFPIGPSGSHVSSP